MIALCLKALRDLDNTVAAAEGDAAPVVELS